MGFGLLFVPLMGGYLFLTWSNSTRFLVRRQSGHHLLFRSASVGLVLLAVAQVLEVVAGDLATWPHVVDAWQRAAPFPYVGTTAVAFLLGPTAALATNLFYPESKGAMRAVRRASDYMELLFVESMRSDSLVELTLQSGKAYVGWILNASVPDPERKFVEMLPLASGFRAKENHKLEFTTNYAVVLAAASDFTESATQSDFRVVLPVTELRSARAFDFATYFEFQESGTIN